MRQLDDSWKCRAAVRDYISKRDSKTLRFWGSSIGRRVVLNGLKKVI